MNDEAIAGTAAAIFVLLFLAHYVIIKPLSSQEGRARMLGEMKRSPLGTIAAATIMAILFAFFIGMATGNKPLFFYSFGGMILVSICSAVVSHLKRRNKQ